MSLLRTVCHTLPLAAKNHERVTCATVIMTKSAKQATNAKCNQCKKQQSLCDRPTCCSPVFINYISALEEENTFADRGGGDTGNRWFSLPKSQT